LSAFRNLLTFGSTDSGRSQPVRTHFICVALVVAAIVCSPLCAAQSIAFTSEIQARQNLEVASPATTNAIPFQLAGGFLIEIEGEIGHLADLKFILDTGATHSVVDQRVANRFSAARRPKKVFNFDGFVSVDWMEFPYVHFGSIEVHNFPMMVTELAKSSEFIPDADAIIGLDLLNTASKLGIFYDSKIVVLKPRDPNAQGASRDEQPECFTVQVLLQGHPIRLLFDTGMEGILLYEDRIRRHIPDLRLTDVRKDAHQGRLRGKTARLSALRLAGSESDVAVFLVKSSREDVLPDIDGYLGTAPLKANRIELDFVGKTLRWQ
jgi:predicted aspartyl protease